MDNTVDTVVESDCAMSDGNESDDNVTSVLSRPVAPTSLSVSMIADTLQKVDISDASNVDNDNNRTQGDDHSSSVMVKDCDIYTNATIVAASDASASRGESYTESRRVDMHPLVYNKYTFLENTTHTGDERIGDSHTNGYNSPGFDNARLDTDTLHNHNTTITYTQPNETELGTISGKKYTRRTELEAIHHLSKYF